MKEPYEEGVAIHLAPSFAPDTVKCSVKRKQGHRARLECPIWRSLSASRLASTLYR